MQDPDQKKLRARALIQKIVYEGKTQKQAAAELGISHDTAARTLTWAKQANIFNEYQQRMWDELIPRAHDAIKMALEDGDADIAIKLYQGTFMLKKEGPKSKAAVQEEDDFYGELQRIRSGNVITIGAGTIDETADPLDVADGDTVERSVDGTEEATEIKEPFGGQTSLSSASRSAENLNDDDE